MTKVEEVDRIGACTVGSNERSERSNSGTSIKFFVMRHNHHREEKKVVGKSIKVLFLLNR